MARKKTRARLVTVDPTLPVEPSQHLPGSKEKIKELANRYQGGQLLHVEGDLLTAEGVALRFQRARNGVEVNTGEEASHSESAFQTAENGPGKSEKCRRMTTAVSTTHRVSVGVLAYGCRLGERIRQERERRGWSLGQLALASGVHRGAIWNIEQGERANPAFLTIVLLADALGISLDSLVDRQPA